MKPISGVFVALLVGVSLGCNIALSTTITWNGSVSTNWNDPLNWTPQQIPAGADHVVFNSGSLTVPINGAFAIMDWTGGNISGALTVASTSTLNLSGTSARTLFGVMTNFGRVVVTMTSYLQEYYAPGSGYFGAIYNQSGALFDIQDDQFYAYTATGNEVFYNVGTLRKSAGTGTTQIYPQVVNTGLVDAETGTISFLGGGPIGGQYFAATGAALSFNGGNYTGDPTTQFSGSGAFKFNGGTLTLPNNVVPNLQLVGGTLVLGPSFQGGSITNLTVAGIAMQFTNTLSGVLNWTAGNLSGALTVQNAGTVNLSGSTARTLFGVLTNFGHVVVTATSYLQEYYAPGSGYFGAIYNQPGGLFEVQDDQFYLYTATGNEVFYNAGTLRKSAATGTTQVYPQLFNTGLVDAESGTIGFLGGGTIAGQFFAATGATVAFDGGNYTGDPATAFTGPGGFKFNGGILTLPNDAVANLQLVGGTLVLGPSFQGGSITNLTVAGIALQFTNTVSGVLNWTAGNLNGSLTVQSNGTLNLSGSSARTLFGTLTNFGHVVVTATSYLQEYYSPGSGYFGAIYNQPGALFDVQNDQFYLYTATGNEVFYNAGTLRKSAGTGATQIYPQIVNTTGLVDAETGTISFLGGGTISAHYFAATGATLAFSGGNYTGDPTTQFSGSGAFKFIGGTLTLPNDVVANLQLLGGTLLLGPSFQGGSITNLTVAGITMQFTNMVTGVLNWTAGNLNGSLTVENNGTVNLSGSAARTLFGVVTNFGKVVVTATSYLQEYYSPGSGYFGAIYNQPGGLFDVQNDQFYLYTATGNEVFYNAGTLRKSAGTGTTQIYPQLVNTSGLVDAETGTLSFLGGILAGNGELRSGITSAANYGKISISGTPALGGTIGAVLLGGYVPAISSSFNVLSYTAHTGIFTNLDLPIVAQWSTNYTASTFTLTVTGTNNIGFRESGQWTSKGFLLTLNGLTSGDNTIIYASTNLVSWLPIATNLPTNGIIQLLDADSTNFPARFYRAVEQ